MKTSSSGDHTGFHLSVHREGSTCLVRKCAPSGVSALLSSVQLPGRRTAEMGRRSKSLRTLLLGPPAGGWRWGLCRSGQAEHSSLLSAVERVRCHWEYLWDGGEESRERREEHMVLPGDSCSSLSTPPMKSPCSLLSPIMRASGRSSSEPVSLSHHIHLGILRDSQCSRWEF